MNIPQIKDSACDKIMEYVGVGRRDIVLLLADKGIREDDPKLDLRYFINNFSFDIYRAFKKAALKKGASVKEIIFDFDSNIVFEPDSIIKYILGVNPKFLFSLCSNNLYVNLRRIYLNPNIKVIHAQSLTPSIINWFGEIDLGEIKARDSNLKSFIEENRGETCTLATGPTRTIRNSELTVGIPTEVKIATDFLVPRTFNIPAGEVFFQPEEETANGVLCLPSGGIAHHFRVKKPIRFVVMDGLLKKVVTGDKKTRLKFEDLIKKDAKVCEIGIGTNPFVDAVPVMERQHNGSMMAEKKLGTFHVAFGGNEHFGPEYGNIDNDFHADVIFPFGEFKVGDREIVKGGDLLL